MCGFPHPEKVLYIAFTTGLAVMISFVSYEKNLHIHQEGCSKCVLNLCIINYDLSALLLVGLSVLCVSWRSPSGLVISNVPSEVCPPPSPPPLPLPFWHVCTKAACLMCGHINTMENYTNSNTYRKTLKTEGMV